MNQFQAVAEKNRNFYIGQIQVSLHWPKVLFFFGPVLASHTISVTPIFRYKTIACIGFIRIHVNWDKIFEPVSDHFWKQFIVFILDQYRCTYIGSMCKIYYDPVVAHCLITVTPLFHYIPITCVRFIRIHINWAKIFKPVSGRYWKQFEVLIWDQYKWTWIGPQF